jgi:hypothetical protein
LHATSTILSIKVEKAHSAMMTAHRAGNDICRSPSFGGGIAAVIIFASIAVPQ